LNRPFMLLLACATFAFSARPALAQDADEQAAPQVDLAGAKDHPSIPRFPGFYITSYEQNDFKGFDFAVGDGSQRVEGKSWEIGYTLKTGVKPHSALEIVRNYANEFQRHGGVVLSDQGDSGDATLKMPSGNGELWLSVDVIGDTTEYSLIIVETAAMQQKIEVSADAMAKALNDDGHIALHGILFDTAKAAIRPESGPLLDEIAKLLQSDPSLKLAIQGHTDNTGAKAANRALSEQRAAAVKQALLTRGIAADRLTTQGLGDSKPVADNATPAGRAKNRRVELVKI